MKATLLLVALLAIPTVVNAQQTRTRVVISDSFSPKTGDEALRNFRPDVPPVDSGGECSVTRTAGNGSVVASATFPSRTNPLAHVSLTFDSAGHLFRYTESRGTPTVRIPAAASDAERDSLMRAAREAHRSTSFTFTWPLDQAVLVNNGGGRPTDAVPTNIRAAERLESLGVPADRIERVRKLCGV